MNKPDNKKPKDKEPQVDFSKVSVDDIAKRFLETPPKSRTKKEKRNETN